MPYPYKDDSSDEAEDAAPKLLSTVDKGETTSLDDPHAEAANPRAFLDEETFQKRLRELAFIAMVKRCKYLEDKVATLERTNAKLRKRASRNKSSGSGPQLIVSPRVSHCNNC